MAERLGRPYLDVDREIEARAGKTIKEIFADSGEPHFRDLEREVAIDLMQQDECVIAFGGGTITLEPVQQLIDDQCLVVYLKVPVTVLWERAHADPKNELNRPNLLAGGQDEIRAMLEKRTPVYEAFAGLTLDGTEPPEDLAGQILEAAI